MRSSPCEAYLKLLGFHIERYTRTGFDICHAHWEKISVGFYIRYDRFTSLSWLFLTLQWRLVVSIFFLYWINWLVDFCTGALEARTNDGSTPLIVATTNCHLQSVQLLVTSGANIDAQNEDGRTAVGTAAYQVHTCIHATYIHAYMHTSVYTVFIRIRGAYLVFGPFRGAHIRGRTLNKVSPFSCKDIQILSKFMVFTYTTNMPHDGAT